MRVRIKNLNPNNNKRITLKPTSQIKPHFTDGAVSVLAGSLDICLAPRDFQFKGAYTNRLFFESMTGLWHVFKNGLQIIQNAVLGDIIVTLRDHDISHRNLGHTRVFKYSGSEKAIFEFVAVTSSGDPDPYGSYGDPYSDPDPYGSYGDPYGSYDLEGGDIVLSYQNDPKAIRRVNPISGDVGHINNNIIDIGGPTHIVVSFGDIPE